MHKLLQINISINRGSTGKIAEQIGLLAREHGWDCYVAYGNFNINSKLKTYRFRTTWDKRLHQAESFLLDRQGLGSRSSTKGLVEYIKQLQPDIIHLHNIHGYYINYPILFDFLKEYGKPVVWTLHDCWTMTGHCTHFVTANCNKWKTVCHDCPLLRDYPSSLFVDRSRQNYKEKKKAFTGLSNLTMIPVSDWLADFVRESYLSYAKIKTIHNGIDLNLFKPSCKKGHINGTFNILSVANVWNEDKGLGDFTKLRKLLPSEYKITLVGLKPKQLEKLPEGIIGICRTENQQALVDLYSKSDVLANVTYADTFPTVNLEALACGTPVITYKTGGSPEAIDEKTGVVVEQGNVEAMAKAIMCMKENPLSSTDCRIRAEECFDKDKCFEEYIHLYNVLLGK